MAHYHGRLVAGHPYFHPPIPADFDMTTSARPIAQFSTGSAPGPYPDTPRDPRLMYPNKIEKARPNGQGCASCLFASQCLLMHWQVNYGWIDHEYVDNNGVIEFAPSVGTACASWNPSTPLTPLPPEDYNNDGLGLGDPVSTNTLPASAFNYDQYEGQYGFGALDGLEAHEDIRNT